MCARRGAVSVAWPSAPRGGKAEKARQIKALVRRAGPRRAVARLVQMKLHPPLPWSRPMPSSSVHAHRAMRCLSELLRRCLLALALPSMASATAQAAEITLVTDFGVNGRHAYFFVAQEKGYYREAGLNVSIVRGQGSADAIKKVAAGSAQVGFADAASLVLARANDEVPVKLLSIVYQQPPQAIFALESSGIRTAQDLVGRKIADTASSAVPLLFGAYAQKAGVAKDKVSWMVADGASLPAVLATGRADAIGQFTVGEALLQKAVAPQKLVRLAYKDIGLSYYGNGLIASETMLRQQPEVLKAFIGATLRGMQEAFRDPAAAGRILHAAHKQVDPAVAEAETRAVAELAQNPEGAMGGISASGVRKTIDTVAAAYSLKRPVTPEEMFAPGFAPR
jgi:NitT/TauT family transport system substrate-binding protein